MDKDIIKDEKTGIVKIRKYARFDKKLLPVIQNLIGLGFSESDIGVILGYGGKEPKKYLKDLKKRYPEVRDACRVGKQIADIQLVVRAYQAALGGEYEEEERIYDGNGNLRETRIRKRLIKPDKSVLIKLLESRMPDLFGEVKITDKRSLNVDITGEIRDFFGNLTKTVDSQEVTEKLNNGL